MNLIETMMDDCTIVNRIETSDGAGGNTTVWQDGASFRAAITMDTTLEAQIALSQGVKTIYTITTRRNVRLRHDSFFRRLNDGAIFRVTSDINTSPQYGSLDMAQVKAERTELSD